MSRARNIKPGFFKNDLLAECQPLARILFAGLWCEADREGRLEDRPKRIKAECLGYDECDIDALLTELSSRGFITRYVVDGKAYIAVNEFSKHQNPHMREPASLIPAPDKHSASTVQAPVKTGTGPALSPSLIPDTSKQEHVPQAARFDEFWTAYPIKRGKKTARDKWKAKKLDAVADRLIADVRKRVTADQQWRDGYAPHASTYLHQERWEDELAGRNTDVKSQPTKPSSHAIVKPTPTSLTPEKCEENLGRLKNLLGGLSV